MPISLDEIVAHTRLRVAERKRESDLRELEARAAEHQPRGFRAALERGAQGDIAIIAELKMASPSKGILRMPLHVSRIACDYQDNGAAALSVLTEEKYFQGSLANLCEASAATTLPCLRKDFIVDEFQIVEARANRADAILLIAAMLSDAELLKLWRHAREWKLDVLCEVHTPEELQRAAGTGCDIIGVNSRNLRTFDVDLRTAEALAERMPAGVLSVAESGIHTPGDIDRLLRAGYQAFLIGESLMRAESPGAALAALLQGSAVRGR